MTGKLFGIEFTIQDGEYDGPEYLREPVFHAVTIVSPGTHLGDPFAYSLELVYGDRFELISLDQDPEVIY